MTDAVSVNGKGKATTKVNPGSIDKGDGSPPQEITADGKGTTFTVPGVQSITGPGGAVVPAVAPITVHIFAVSPSNTSKGAIGSVCASGTHVEFNQPSTATGGYSRDVKYILGEGCSEAFVLTIPDSILNPPAVSIDSSGDLVSSGGGTSTTTTTSSVPGSSSISDGFTGAAPSTFVSNGRAAAGKAAASGRSRRLALVSTRVPLPLAAIFFLWEALVLGAAASTVWARRLSSVPR